MDDIQYSTIIITLYFFFLQVFFYLKTLNLGKDDGFVIVAKRLNDLVMNALNKIDSKTPIELVVVGMCLSGGGTPIANKRLTEAFGQLHVNYKFYITNDALAPIYTAFKNGLLFLNKFYEFFFLLFFTLTLF